MWFLEDEHPVLSHGHYSPVEGTQGESTAYLIGGVPYEDGDRAFLLRLTLHGFGQDNAVDGHDDGSVDRCHVLEGVSQSSESVVQRSPTFVVGLP